MQTFLIRYIKETVNEKNHKVKIEEKEQYIQAEDFGKAYKKAKSISGACCIELLDINTVIHDIKNLREKIEFITTNSISPDLDLTMDFKREFQILEEEKNKFLESTRLI